MGIVLDADDLREQPQELRLEVIGPLVFGDLLEHHLKAFQLLVERGGSTVFLLRLEVLLCKIRGHGNRSFTSNN